MTRLRATPKVTRNRASNVIRIAVSDPDKAFMDVSFSDGSYVFLRTKDKGQYGEIAIVGMNKQEAAQVMMALKRFVSVETE